VLDSGCTNHMTRERRMFPSFEKNESESDCIMFDENYQGQVLGFGKLLSQTNIQFLLFLLFYRWTIICYSFHNFVRCVTIICLLIRV
jgi:hypothetical protein